MMGLTDKLKQAVSGGGSSSTSGNAAAGGATTQGAAAGGAAQQKDYGDKAFDFVSKKTGHKFDESTSEKITDGARSAYEKATGSKVNPKFSN